jgi:hypothetical protein
MATLADFVGTWYFRGYQTHPCSVRLQGGNRVVIRDEHGYEYAGRVEGDTLMTESLHHPGLHGVMTSDTKRIDWTNGENWQR